MGGGAPWRTWACAWGVDLSGGVLGHGESDFEGPRAPERVQNSLKTDFWRGPRTDINIYIYIYIICVCALNFEFDIYYALMLQAK